MYDMFIRSSFAAFLETELGKGHFRAKGANDDIFHVTFCT